MNTPQAPDDDNIKKKIDFFLLLLNKMEQKKVANQNKNDPINLIFGKGVLQKAVSVADQKEKAREMAFYGKILQIIEDDADTGNIFRGIHIGKTYDFPSEWIEKLSAQLQKVGISVGVHKEQYSSSYVIKRARPGF